MSSTASLSPKTSSSHGSPKTRARGGSISDAFRSLTMLEKHGRVPKGMTCRGRQCEAHQSGAMWSLEGAPLSEPTVQAPATPTSPTSPLTWPVTNNALGRRERINAGGSFDEILDKDKSFAAMYEALGFAERERVAAMWESGDMEVLRELIAPPGVLKRRSPKASVTVNLDSSTDSISTTSSTPEGKGDGAKQRISFADPPVVSTQLLSPVKRRRYSAHRQYTAHGRNPQLKQHVAAAAAGSPPRMVHIPNAFVAVAHHKRTQAQQSREQTEQLHIRRDARREQRKRAQTANAEQLAKVVLDL